MKHSCKKHLAGFLVVLTVATAVMGGCGAQKTGEPAATETEGTAGTAQTGETEAVSPDREELSGQPESGLAPGDVVSGFTVTSLSGSRMLQADIIGFTHEQSGAQLVWIRNSDPELAFSISYHTPYIDETDTNHVFEHAILASSEKYPSKDLFFDLAGKSYNTFINAFTYNTFTTYPVSSESEDQLLKLMDAYLSCMVAPDILKNENIFKREALRYELDSPEGDIRMIGTVYSEDFGFLTDMFRESTDHVEDALYPGQYASNAVGRSHRNYENLTYEAVVDTYRRYYHFDNSLILLYGDLDGRRVLSFIDQEYLSKARRQGTDLSAYRDPASEDGFVERTVSVPAFEGDQTEGATQILYAFSLEDAGWEDLTAWDVLTDMLDHENAAFHRNLKAQGLENPAGVYINPHNAKPYLLFCLYYGEPEQSQAFRKAVEDTLDQVGKEGVDGDIVRSVLKRKETSSYLLRDQRNVGVNVFPDLVNYWTHTGSFDYYGVYEKTLKDLEEDKDQAIFRRLAAKVRDGGRSALVTNVPEPGLAEELIAQRDAYLADMKASMSEEELRQMIKDTESFREWNQSEGTNRDFMIDPSELPDEVPFTGYEKEEGDGVTFYMAPAKVEQAGSYRLYLELGGFSGEEQMALGLYGMLAGNMGTREHTLEEMLNLKSQYLYDFDMEWLYPEGEGAVPVLKVSWTTLTGDYEAGLDLVLEMLGSTDFTATERTQELLNRENDFYDISRAEDKLIVARDLAASSVYRDYGYREAYLGQEFYYYLEDTREKLEKDSSYGQVLAEDLRALSDKLMRKGRLVFTCAAPEEDLETIRKVSGRLLEALPAGEPGEGTVTLPRKARKRAVIVESPDQYGVCVGDCYEAEGFSGKYVPFLMAAADRYTVPRLRFQMGAYSSGITFSADNGALVMYSDSDPNAADTVRVFEGTADAIADMELTSEDLDGYILTAVATSGMARGVLTKPILAMEDEILGRDTRKACQMVNAMKQAVAEDQEAAAECFREVIKESGMAVVGNEEKLKADQDAFDELLSYKE